MQSEPVPVPVAQPKRKRAPRKQGIPALAERIANLRMGDRRLLALRERREAGEPVDFETLCRDHPGLEVELLRLRAAEEIVGVEPNVSLHAEEEKSSEPPTSQLLERLKSHAVKSTRYRLRGDIARGGGWGRS